VKIENPLHCFKKIHTYSTNTIPKSSVSKVPKKMAEVISFTAKFSAFSLANWHINSEYVDILS